ncbi:hypothetical protein AQUCO_06100040v1 [Aquilegia coerulea]|uniref:Uncharacterized protein n=1 Tax=Aquilegia coerulea TaxID=218851 RepID=A0A2G5CDB7_AQUCA|nr:hypothetical protein AQUCO_06100040v1 [Aquilegia coerulea]
MVPVYYTECVNCIRKSIMIIIVGISVSANKFNCKLTHTITSVQEKYRIIFPTLTKILFLKQIRMGNLVKID